MANALTGKSYIVTGGSGFIGSHLIRTLLDQGAHRIYNLDPGSMRTFSDHPRWQDVAHNRTGTDEIDPAKFLEMVKIHCGNAPDGIFHMGVIPLRLVQENPARAIEVNIGGTHKIVELARLAQDCRIVFSSASSVYGDTDEVMDEALPFRPTTFYGASKAASELWLQAAWSEWGVPSIALRYMNVYGPGQMAGLIPFQMGRIQQGLGPRIEGDGSAEFDFVYVADVVQANLRAMTGTILTSPMAMGKAYNVGSGQHATVGSICEKLQEIAGTELEPEYVPERPGAVRRRVGSSNRIARELGYQPSVSLNEGLRRTWEAKTGQAARI